MPEKVMQEMKSVTDPSTGELIIPLDENLFSSLYFFVLEVLEGYYKDFQKSRKYDNLKDEVSKQEILYEYLRRYSMISN